MIMVEDIPHNLKTIEDILKKNYYLFSAELYIYES